MAVERALPDNIDYKESGCYELLVERYSIAKQFVAGKIVLDSCCGTGWGTFYYLTKDAKHVTGIDISEEALISYDFKKDNFQLLKRNVLNSEFKSNSFDVTLALESIEHFDKQDGVRYIAELHRVTKSDGILMGTTPLCVHKSMMSVLLGINKHHLYMYTPKKLRQILKLHFSSVRIYKFYNKTFPYLLFFCAEKIKPVQRKEIIEVVSSFSGSKSSIRENKAHHYDWCSKQLQNKGDFVNFRRMHAVALLQIPKVKSYFWWRDLFITVLPVNVVKIIKKLKNIHKVSIFKRNVKQTWASMQWKDWSAWTMSKVNKYCPNAKDILEIGGQGKELKNFIHRRNFQTLNFPESDICKRTAFSSSAFDLIYCKHTFEHLYNPFDAAKEINRILKPGGVVIVITHWSWRYHGAHNFGDYWRFSEPGLKLLFSELDILESAYDISERRKDCRLNNVPVDKLGGWREHWHVYLIGKKR